MKNKFAFLLLFHAFLFNAQISNKLKKKIELIDEKYFALILQESYDSKAYDELNKLYSEISKTATNDELFFLALNGNTFIRYNAASNLASKKDSRTIHLYKYYSKFPMEYNKKMGHVWSIQDMAFSIRSLIILDLESYQQYKILKDESFIKVSNFYSKEDINYYENLDPQILRNFITEFEKIDKIFIPERLEVYKEIKDNWIDDKLQKPNYN
ncbi:MAG TPA: hypothetical protein VF455_03750 [Chryseobacterium sp.]